MRLALLTPAAAAALVLAGCGERGGEAGNAAAPADDSAANAAQPAANAAGPGAPGPPARPVEPGDVDAAGYLALAASENRYAIEAARLAVEQAETEAVRGLARLILADHQRSARALAAAAAQADPPLRMPTALPAERRAGLDRLRGLSGAEFDREYLAQQVEGHEAALRLATAYAIGGEVPALRQQAATAAEPVQRHLARARLIAERR